MYFCCPNIQLSQHRGLRAAHALATTERQSSGFKQPLLSISAGLGSLQMGQVLQCITSIWAGSLHVPLMDFVLLASAPCCLLARVPHPSLSSSVGLLGSMNKKGSRVRPTRWKAAFSLMLAVFVRSSSLNGVNTGSQQERRMCVSVLWLL